MHVTIATATGWQLYLGHGSLFLSDGTCLPPGVLWITQPSLQHCLHIATLSSDPFIVLDFSSLTRLIQSKKQHLSTRYASLSAGRPEYQLRRVCSASSVGQAVG